MGRANERSDAVLTAAGLSLLWRRRFGPLFVVQFLGAFNDNALKFAMLFFVSFALYQNAATAGLFSVVATGVFILPYFLFSALAGEIADHYDKAKLIRLVKGAELLIVTLATLGFLLHSIVLLLLTLFLMGCHSSVFGPTKYAILPQHLVPAEIVGGTALVEAGTFTAILGGQLFAGVGGPARVMTFVILFALVGFIASFAIPAAPPLAGQQKLRLHLLAGSREILRKARENERLWLPILGVSWFFAAGAVLLSVFVPLVSGVLQANAGVATLFLLVFSLSVAAGALSMGQLSRGRILPQYTLHTATLMALGLGGLALAASLYQPGGTDVRHFLASAAGCGVILSLFLTAFAGGMFIVPLYALLQTEGAAAERSRVIAANNIMNAALTVLLVLAASGLLAAGASIPLLLGVLGGVTLLFASSIALRISRFEQPGVPGGKPRKRLRNPT